MTLADTVLLRALIKATPARAALFKAPVVKATFVNPTAIFITICPCSPPEKQGQSDIERHLTPQLNNLLNSTLSVSHWGSFLLPLRTRHVHIPCYQPTFPR